jgi:hypothetical protein
VKFQISHPDVMFSYVVYIKDQWDSDPDVCDLKELRSCALIQTSKGFVNPSLEPVHFTVEYGNKINLQKEFPSKLYNVVIFVVVVVMYYAKVPLQFLQTCGSHPVVGCICILLYGKCSERSVC